MMTPEEMSSLPPGLQEGGLWRQVIRDELQKALSETSNTRQEKKRRILEMMRLASANDKRLLGITWTSPLW